MMASPIRGFRDVVRGVFSGRWSLAPVVAVAAYFDDSRKRGIYSVAGYLGLVGVWDEAFSPIWAATVKQAPHPITEFKASDCSNGLAEFQPPWTKAERDGLTEKLVNLLIDEQLPHVIGLGAAVVLPKSIDNESKRAKWERFAYLLCMGTVISHVGFLCRRFLSEDSILFVFDEQKGMQGKAVDMFAEARAEVQAEGQLNCDVAGPLFRSSETTIPLQAADLLAYETMRELDNREAVPPIKQRMALRRLVEGRAHYAHYYNADALRRLRDKTVGTYADLPKVYEQREIPRH